MNKEIDSSFLSRVGKRMIEIQAYKEAKDNGSSTPELSLIDQVLSPWARTERKRIESDPVLSGNIEQLQAFATVPFWFVDIASDVAPIAIAVASRIEPAFAIPIILAIKAGYNVVVGAGSEKRSSKK